MQVSIREMKNSLSKYLKLVRSGKAVVITDRGKPVAQLTPIAAAETDAEQEEIRRILALPWVRPGNGGKPRGARKPIKLRGRGQTAAEILLGDRD